MSSAIPIATRRQDSYPSGASPSSPVTHSPIHRSGSLNSSYIQSAIGVPRPKVLKPFAEGELRLLLVENISQEAVQAFKANGFQVDHFTKAWSEEELIAKIGSYHAIGIRSKTKITEKVLAHATKVCLHRSTC